MFLEPLVTTSNILFFRFASLNSKDIQLEDWKTKKNIHIEVNFCLRIYCPRCQKNGRSVRSTKQLIVSVLEVALSFTGAQFVVPQSDSDQCSSFYFQLQECALHGWCVFFVLSCPGLHFCRLLYCQPTIWNLSIQLLCRFAADEPELKPHLAAILQYCVPCTCTRERVNV